MLPRKYVGIIYVRKLRYYLEQRKRFELRMRERSPSF